MSSVFSVCKYFKVFVSIFLFITFSKKKKFDAQRFNLFRFQFLGFSQSIYSASVKEDVPKGTEVLRVVASDADDGRNSDIRYAIRNASDLSFTIGETSGALVTTG
jgi:hypothetical protein